MKEFDFVQHYKHQKLIANIAIQFAKDIREQLSPKQLIEVNASNKLKGNELLCDTHNYIDSNMSMLWAYSQVLGIHEDDVELGDALVTIRMNEAWTLAKQLQFDEERLQIHKDSIHMVDMNVYVVDPHDIVSIASIPINDTTIPVKHWLEANTAPEYADTAVQQPKEHLYSFGHEFVHPEMPDDIAEVWERIKIVVAEHSPHNNYIRFI